MTVTKAMVGKALLAFGLVLQFWGQIKETSCQPDGSVTERCFYAALLFSSEPALLISFN